MECLTSTIESLAFILPTVKKNIVRISFFQARELRNVGIYYGV